MRIEIKKDKKGKYKIFYENSEIDVRDFLQFLPEFSITDYDIKLAEESRETIQPLLDIFNECIHNLQCKINNEDPLDLVSPDATKKNILNKNFFEILEIAKKSNSLLKSDTSKPYVDISESIELTRIYIDKFNKLTVDSEDILLEEAELYFKNEYNKEYWITAQKRELEYFENKLNAISDIKKDKKNIQSLKFRKDYTTNLLIRIMELNHTNELMPIINKIPNFNDLSQQERINELEKLLMKTKKP